MTENASRFPLFVDLNGRRCVIVGGGAIAQRRAAVLAHFGAAVTVIAPTWTGAVPGPGPSPVWTGRRGPTPPAI